jgi:predicted phage-related endonuclease
MPGRGYVGGGSIAAICELSPHTTKLEAYLHIVEGSEPASPDKQAFFDSRRELEPWAAAKFARRTSLSIVRSNERYQDDEFPWAKAEIDFEASDGGNGETKTVNESSAWLWGNADLGEEPPMYVEIQAMWGMGVHPASHCYVNAMIGFDKHYVYRVERDDDLIRQVRQRAADFWNHHIIPRRPPAPSNLRDVLTLYGRDSGRAVEASPEVKAALESLSATKNQQKLIGLKREAEEFLIKKFMLDAGTLTVGGITAATWKADSRGTRIFRVK